MPRDPLDLLHQGAERVIGVYVLDTEDGPALFDCGPTSCAEQLKAGLRARGLELGDVRHLLLSHIHLDHAGASRSARARAPGVAGARLGDRRPASRRPVPARGERAPALRRRLRRALGRARARAGGERARRRRPRARARVLSHRPGTRAITSATSTATERCMRATPPACASSRIVQSCPRRRRRSSTSTSG